MSSKPDSKKNSKKESKVEPPYKTDPKTMAVIKDYLTNWLDGPISIRQGETTGTLNDTNELYLRSLCGTYDVDETKWRILGMVPGSLVPQVVKPTGENTELATSVIPKTEEIFPLTVEYSVLQLPQTYGLLKEKPAAGQKTPIRQFEEQLPKSRNEQILRVCFSDNEKILGAFRQEREILKIIRKKYAHNSRFYNKFPRLLAEGELSKLKGIYRFERDKIWIYSPKIHKPFFVYEKIGPTLEDFHNCQHVPGRIMPYCSVFIIVGCLQALRLCHEAGIVVCDVQPRNFSIRLGPTGTLHRREADIINAIVLTNFHQARGYRSQPYRKQTSWGTRKWASPAVMRHEPNRPVDDVVSLIYMLHEFLTNGLPWIPTENRGVFSIRAEAAIAKDKEEFEKKKRIIDENDQHKKEVFVEFNELFAQIRRANGMDVPLNYDKLNKLLTRGIHHRTDVERGRSTFAFYQPTMTAYRHGIEDKIDCLFPKGATTGEDEKTRYMADWLFSCSKNKRKEDLKKEDKNGSKQQGSHSVDTQK